MADAWHLPVTTHNCGSPVLTHVCAHLLYSCPNTTLMETVRSLYKTYADTITDAKVDIRDGHIHLSDKPGLGIKLRDDVLKARDTVRVETKAVRRDQMFAVNGDPWAQCPAHQTAVKPSNPFSRGFLRVTAHKRRPAPPCIWRLGPGCGT